MWDVISTRISDTRGKVFNIVDKSPIGGGCINSAYRISDRNTAYFVKTNRHSELDMFAAEFDGLNEIINSKSIRAPMPVCFGSTGQYAYIVMEDLHFNNKRNTDASIQRLGVDLATMHGHESGQYGWFRDNTIGSITQINASLPNWISFWRDNRIGYQLNLAANRGYGKELMSQGELLMTQMEKFFSGYNPKASLVHGDLWSGNYAILDTGEPVIFDPAVYYGDRETDIAMTELFGGFPPAFYSAYNEAYPLDSGYQLRKTLYNLYHILNHLNLFGGGYLRQAQHMIDQLLGDIK